MSSLPSPPLRYDDQSHYGLMKLLVNFQLDYFTHKFARDREFISKFLDSSASFHLNKYFHTVFDHFTENNIKTGPITELNLLKLEIIQSFSKIFVSSDRDEVRGYIETLKERMTDMCRIFAPEDSAMDFTLQIQEIIDEFEEINKNFIKQEGETGFRLLGANVIHAKVTKTLYEHHNKSLLYQISKKIGSNYDLDNAEEMRLLEQLTSSTTTPKCDSSIVKQEPHPEELNCLIMQLGPLLEDDTNTELEPTNISEAAPTPKQVKTPKRRKVSKEQSPSPKHQTEKKKADVKKSPPPLPCDGMKNEDNFTCKLCNLTFDYRYELMYHEIMEHGNSKKEMVPTCPFCLRDFRSTALKMHLVIHTDEKPHKCTACQKAFNSMSGLQMHSREHTKNRIYKCHVCRQKFTIAANLRLHVQRHHPGEVTAAKRSLGSGSSTYSPSSVKTHDTILINESPY